MDKFYFTRDGLSELRKRLDKLERELQKLEEKQTSFGSEEILPIDTGRGMYRQLDYINKCLSLAVIVDPPTSFDRVTIGTRVRVIRDGEEAIWNIVGFSESRIKDENNLFLSYNTPLASLVMGKRENEVVTGIIAGRQTEVEIVEISKMLKEGEDD